MTRRSGFIDFGDEDRWRSEITKDSSGGGKLFIAQGARCHESHPDLQLGGGTLIGGNCRDHKRHKGVDLYVALDGSQEHPLFEIGELPPRCVYYPIQNMGIPARPDKFKALIEMILLALSAGNRVHVGCIGGHGRTGMVIAAVVARLNEPGFDAIKWTRDNYCIKAVETKPQEGFLVTQFGVKMQPGSKTPYQNGKTSNRR